MKIAGSLRRQLGLTQQQLADFIGADRSSLARVESGERPITGTAVDPLLALQAAGKGFRQARAATSLTTEQRAALREEGKFCRLKHARLEKQLALVQQKAATALRLQHTVATLKDSPAGLTKKQKRWLDEQAWQAEKKLAAFGPEQQWRLRLQLELLKTEAAFWERMAE